MTKRRTTVAPRKRKYPVATWNEERQAIDVDDVFIPVTIVATDGRGNHVPIENGKLKNIRLQRTRMGNVMFSAEGTVAVRLKVTVPTRFALPL